MEINNNARQKNRRIMIGSGLLIIAIAIVIGLIFTNSSANMQTEGFNSWFSKVGNSIEKAFLDFNSNDDNKNSNNRARINIDVDGLSDAGIDRNWKKTSFNQTISVESQTEVSYSFDTGNLEVIGGTQKGIISGSIDYAGKTPLIDYTKSYQDRLEIISLDNWVNLTTINLPEGNNISAVHIFGKNGNLNVDLEKTITDTVSIILDTGNIAFKLPQAEYMLTDIVLGAGNITLYAPKEAIYWFEFANGVPDYSFESSYLKTEKSIKDRNFDNYYEKQGSRIHVRINQSAGNFKVIEY